MISIFLLMVAGFGGLIAGFGGPGGLPIIAYLYSFASLSTAEVAGTSSSIFVFATIFAISLYYISGDINLSIVWPLVPTTLIGTKLGVWANSFIPRKIFGILISFITISIGLTVVYRELKSLEPVYNLDYRSNFGKFLLGLLGVIVGFLGGVIGIGGPAISIPVLIFLGISPLLAIGAGLVQGFFVTASTATNYALSGNINFNLFIKIAPLYILSQAIGWYIAQKIDTRRLKVLIGSMLTIVGVYIVLTL